MNLEQARSKHSLLESLLAEGMVLAALDARTSGVVVPAHLADDIQLRLNLSRRFGLPLEVDAWGVQATLTFAGNPFPCRLPWSAIFLLVSHVNGQPYLFPDDIPGELLAHNRSGGQSARPRLAVVRPPGASEALPAAAAPRCRPAARAAGSRHLRLVKQSP